MQGFVFERVMKVFRGKNEEKIETYNTLFDICGLCAVLLSPHREIAPFSNLSMLCT